MKTNVLIVLAFVVILASCKEKRKSPLIPEVNVVEVTQKDVPVYAEYVGETFGKSDVEIKPRVEGWVQAIHFKEGAAVTEGQLLYVIQDDELRDREQAAAAQLSQANIMLVKVKADLDRVKPLAQMNALSKRDLDAAQASYDAQRQAVTAAQAALNNARTQLNYSKITAPISGIIGISKVQVGDYVNKLGQQSINTISAVGEMRIRFTITENDYLMFREKMSKDSLKDLSVDLILGDGTLFDEKGRFDLVNREIDPTTGSLLVQAVVENKSRLLRPGQYIKVRFQSDKIQNAILVPQQAVNQMQSMYLTYVVNDSNKINPRPVKTGIRIGSDWVITEGLKPGEKVALVGNAIIKPGMEVKPVVGGHLNDSVSSKR